MVHTKKGIKANWIGHVLCRNCLPKHVIEGKIRGTERRGRRRKQLLNDFKVKRRHRKLKEETLNYTLCSNGFGRCCGHFARQNT